MTVTTTTPAQEPLAAEEAVPVVWFADLSAGDAAVAGGKGANLGELTRAGLPVPPGFVVTAGAYLAFPDQAEKVAALPVDGVGLLRAEFLLTDALQGVHPKRMLAEGRRAEFADRMHAGLVRITRRRARPPTMATGPERAIAEITPCEQRTTSDRFASRFSVARGL